MRAAGIIAVGALALLANACGDPPRVDPVALPGPAASVYKDPVTGRFAQPPAPRVLAPAGRLSTSSDGLGEVVGPRGGWMVRLQGRFQNQVQATRSKGALSAECRPDQGPR